MTDAPFDIAIIGGGINGAGIARDAAGRGLRVLLVEKGDLACGTSSASSKLIHGGLRYLEHYEFRLVREALAEREVLRRIAPHIIWPLPFILPHHISMRPRWLLRAGLFLYDALATKRSLPASAAVLLGGEGVYGSLLKPHYAKGYRYSDCWVDDARLVVLNARDAADNGADIRTRTACMQATRKDGLWRLTLEGGAEASARILINAAGPWVDAVTGAAGAQNRGKARLVKGSHIVVPRIHEGEHAYILQLPDKRIQFVLPFEEQFSLIGTTDVAYDGNPAEVAISEAEIAYLLEGVNAYLAKPLTRDDVVWSYAGVRALYDDASANLSAITRDYVLELDAGEDAPLLTIFGGKITTYRRLAEQVMEKLYPYLPAGAHHPWTATRPLPGGGPVGDYPWLDAALLARWKRQYGSRIALLLDGAASMADLGAPIAPQVYAAELEYVYRQEWAQSAQDFLWRRTKLGLVLDSAAVEQVERWFAARKE